MKDLDSKAATYLLSLSYLRYFNLGMQATLVFVCPTIGKEPDRMPT